MSPSSTDRLAVVEAGSNSLKLYLVSPAEGEDSIEVFKYPWSVAHVFFSTGAITTAVVDEIIACLGQAREAAAGIDLARAPALATGVFRELPELQALLDRVKAETGVRLRLITGADEARLMARGFRDLDMPRPALLCDLGGATTEWVWLRDGHETECGSMRLGAIRNEYALAAQRDGDDPSLDDYLAASDALCDAELEQLPVSGDVHVVVTGGTAEALSLIAGSETVDSIQLAAVLDRVHRFGAPPELKPSRQKVFLPGLAILRRLLAHCGARSLRHGTAAVRSGMVRRLLALVDKVPREDLHATQLLRTMDGRSLLSAELAGERELRPGATLGRYRVVGKLGRGAMGAVYRAADPQLGRDIALKIMHARAGAGARLLHEAQALARVSHPNVVAVHDVGLVDDDVFVAMELVEGRTLSQWRSADTRSTDEIVAVFLAAARGLAAIHEKGLIQRDFKPDNVIVGDDGRVRLVDFGLARFAEEPSAASPAAAPTDATKSDTGVVGTPVYMAPEQFARGDIDERTDQFSFCVAFWQALYGELPFRGDTVAEIERAVTNGDLRSPTADVEVPQWLHDAIATGLATDPDERHGSMAALIVEIDRQPRARAAPVLMVSAVALIAIIGLIGFFATRSRGTAAAPPNPCAGAGAQLAGVWDADAKRGVREAFVASGRAHAKVTYRRVEKVLDGYSSAWEVMWTDACESTRVYDQQSEAVLELRNRCLAQRLDGLRELVRRFTTEADARTVDRAVHLAFELEPVEHCADVEALASADIGTPSPATTTTCGLPESGRFNPVEVGRAWVYDVIDPSTGLPRSRDPKVVEVEVLDRIGGCKGDQVAYRVRRTTGNGYALRWVAVRDVDSQHGFRKGQVSTRLRDQWFTHEGRATKDEYYEPARVRLDESCKRTVSGASFVDVYEEVEVEPSAKCGARVDTKTKTFDWQVVATEVPVRLELDYSHPACCKHAAPGKCRPPADGPGHTCKRKPDGSGDEWECRFTTLQVARSEVRGDKNASYWFAPGVGKVQEVSRGEEVETLVCFSIPPK